MVFWRGFVSCACVCSLGFSGSIAAISSSPFFSGQCTHAPFAQFKFNLDPNGDQTGLRSWGDAVQLSEMAFYGDAAAAATNLARAVISDGGWWRCRLSGRWCVGD